MMFLYKLGYGSYEDSMYSEIASEKEFSDDEFKQIVIKAIIRVMEGIASRKYKVYLQGEGPSYEDIHEYVLTELLDADGFQKVEYKSTWGCFGWPSLIEPTSWESQRGKDLIEVTNAIPIDLRNKIKAMIRPDE